MQPIKRLCEICKFKEAVNIHHKDLNHRNNKKENIQYLCVLCHSKIHNISPNISELKRLVLLLNRLQKTRISLVNNINGFNHIEINPPDYLNYFVTFLIKKEKEVEKEIKLLLDSSAYKIWTWLKKIRGINYKLAAKLIVYLDINKAKRISSFWSYCGLKPEDIRIKGKKLNCNKELKSICYQIAKSFIINKSQYKKFYDIEKVRQSIKKDNPPKNKLHIHLRAIRVMLKEFLKDLFIEWKKLSCLNTIEPQKGRYPHLTSSIVFNNGREELSEIPQGKKGICEKVFIFLPNPKLAVD